MQRYKKISTLHTALYGEVLLCKDLITDTTVAVKKMNMDLAENNTSIIGRKVLENAKNEIDINRRLTAATTQDSNIVRMIEDFTEGTYYYEVFEYCCRGELFNVINKRSGIKRSRAINYFRQIVAGLQQIHSLGVAHRDLSLENVFVNGKDQCKIGDFGLAIVSNLSEDRVGKPYYIAPETYTQASHDPIKADIYALGILLFIMLSQQPPFPINPEDDPETILLRYKEFRDGLEHFRQDPIVGLILSITELNPAERPSLEEILSHPSLNPHGTVTEVQRTKDYMYEMTGDMSAIISYGAVAGTSVRLHDHLISRLFWSYRNSLKSLRQLLSNYLLSELHLQHLLWCFR